VGIRIHEAYGLGVVYVEAAIVHHKLFTYRGRFRWLLFRSFWQGYSKRIMDLMLPEAKGDKGDYLLTLLFRYVPMRIVSLIRAPATAKAKQLVALFAFTAAVGFGYLYGLVDVDASELWE
jgi:hypothetical protein